MDPSVLLSVLTPTESVQLPLEARGLALGAPRPSPPTSADARAPDAAADTPSAARPGAETAGWVRPGRPRQLPAQQPQRLRLQVLARKVRRGLRQPDALHGLRLGPGPPERRILPR